MAGYLAKNPGNFRAEIARWQIRQADICYVTGMSPTHLSGMLREAVPMREWAEHNIAFAINHLTQTRLFRLEIDELVEPEIGRPKLHEMFSAAPRGMDIEESLKKIPGGF